jgi:hypothetical protein
VLRELRNDQNDQKDVGLNTAGANFVLQFMKWLDMCVDYRTPNVAQWVHRQNVEVTNAEWTKRRTTKRRMRQTTECQNVE